MLFFGSDIPDTSPLCKQRVSKEKNTSATCEKHPYQLKKQISDHPKKILVMKNATNQNQTLPAQKKATLSDDAFYLIALASLLKKMKAGNVSAGATN